VDGDGALFIADLGNSRVRRVDPRTGIITTVHGLDQVASSGLVVTADGSLFVADLDHCTILRKRRGEGPRVIVGNGGLGYGGGDGRSARAAFLSGPRGLARDGRGNVYVAEAQAHRVRRIDGASGLITTVAGNGIAGYSGDGGLATKASLNQPQGMALDGAGNLLIADMGNHRVRKLASDGTITSIAGTGGAGLGGDGELAALEADLGQPTEVAVDRRGGILVVLGRSGLIYRIDPDSGKLRRLAGLLVERTLLVDGKLAVSGRIDRISAFALTPEGDILIAEEGSLRIRRIDAQTGLVRTVAGRGLSAPTGPPNRAVGVSLANVTSLAVDTTGNMYVAEYGIGIRKIDAATQEVTLLVPASSGVDATGLLFSPPDGLYVADRAGFLRRIGPDGAVVTKAGGGFGF
jgi:DNA-binding beta-propeller fold protein YncE